MAFDFDKIARGLSPDGFNQITGAPKWSEDAARQRVERARGLSNLPYSPFKGSRLAPLNRYQRRASEMVNAELRRRAQDDTYRTIRSEIDAASRDKTHNQVRGYIEAAVSDPMRLHDRFSNRYNQEVLSAMDDSAIQTWLEKLPQLSANAITHGAYHTGANQRARERLARDIGKGLHKEKALFKAQGYENAIQQANRLQDRHLSAGQLASTTLNQDRQTTLDIAQKRSSLDREKTAGEFAGSTALRDIGNIEQAQKQKEYDEAKLRHDEEQNYPWQQLQREAAIHQGSMPIGLEQIAAASYRAPAPANPYTTANAGLADLTKTLIPGKKRGGPITQKFAEGGMPQFPKYTDADLPAMQNPEIDSIRESAQGLKNERNPDKAYYGALASTLLKNVHGSPLQAVGLGMEAGENARTGIMSANDENKVRAAKLMEAINTSRVAQQKILADYSQTQQHNDRTHAYHMASLGETARHNKASEQIQSATLEKKPPKLQKPDEKILGEVNEIYRSAPNLLKNLERMEELMEKLNTGNFAARNLPSYWNAKLPGGLSSGTQADMDEFEKITNEFVADATRKFGQRGGAQIARIIEKGKPHIGNDPEANKRVIQSFKENITRGIDYADFVNDSYNEYGVSPRQADTAYSKYERALKQHPELKDKITPFNFLGIKNENGKLPKNVDTLPATNEAPANETLLSQEDVDKRIAELSKQLGE